MLHGVEVTRLDAMDHGVELPDRAQRGVRRGREVDAEPSTSIGATLPNHSSRVGPPFLQAQPCLVRCEESFLPGLVVVVKV
jgi:hypothetical protein